MRGMRGSLGPLERTRRRVLPWMCGEVEGVSGSARKASGWTQKAGTVCGVRCDSGDTGGCTMSVAICVLPVVRAMAVAQVDVEERRTRQNPALRKGPQRAMAPVGPPAPEMAFYRKYTEALLRRYLRLSMEAGRVPSLLGQEMFRGRMTTYRVRSFEDAVIFVLDVERCLERLGEVERVLITRIALQEYTQAETASLLHMGLRTVVRRYSLAMDQMTEIFLSWGLLEPMTLCQEAGL